MNKGGAPKGNQNAKKIRPEFPDCDLNTMEGIDKALQKLIKLTWEGKIDGRTSASLRNQLKYLAELHTWKALCPTKEEVIMLLILQEELKPYRTALVENYEKYLEENPPTRWEDARFQETDAISIAYEFVYKLPEELRKPVIGFLDEMTEED